MIQVSKDDYVIVRVGTKNQLCLAHNPERNRAIIDKSLLSEDGVKYVDYDEKTLLANLGPKPVVGKSAYGVKIEPYNKSVDTEIGQMHLFRRLKKLERKALMSAIASTYKDMKKAKLDIFPITSIVIKPKSGKYAGMYKFKVTLSEVNDSIHLHPETFEDLKYNKYVLFHEYGHGVWYKRVPMNIKAKWIVLYEKRINQLSILKDRLNPMLDDILNFSGTLMEFQKEMEEEDRLVFKEILNHYKRFHRLDIRALSILLSEDTQAFASMWPKRASIISSVKEDPTTYAMTSPEELFAESFAFHMTNKTLSKDVTKLMQRTLGSLR